MYSRTFAHIVVIALVAIVGIDISAVTVYVGIGRVFARVSQQMDVTDVRVLITLIVLNIPFCSLAAFCLSMQVVLLPTLSAASPEERGGS